MYGYNIDGRNPRYDVSGDGSILLEINLDGEWVPFIARPDDSTEYGPELYLRAVAGEFGPIAPAEAA